MASAGANHNAMNTGNSRETMMRPARRRVKPMPATASGSVPLPRSVHIPAPVTTATTSVTAIVTPR